MNIRRLAAFLAAFSLLFTYSLWAAETNLDCPAPFGGHYGYPPPGLFETQLINEDGDQVGNLKVWNTADKELQFELTPFENIQVTDIQIWTGNDIDEMPTKKGKPVSRSAATSSSRSGRPSSASRTMTPCPAGGERISIALRISGIVAPAVYMKTPERIVGGAAAGLWSARRRAAETWD